MTTLPATPSEASSQHTEAQTPWEILVEKLRELLSSGVAGTFSFIGSNFGQIDVDLESRTYTSAEPLNELPTAPEDMATRYVEDSSKHEAPLDALLWRIGELAYGDSIPSWLPAQASFGLEHWPSFHGFAPTAIEIRLISMLTSNKLTFRELASATSVNLTESQKLVSKLSLLGLVTVVQQEQEVRTLPRAATGRSGLPTQRPGGAKTPVTILRPRSETSKLVEPVSVFDVAKRHRAELGDALPELDLELVVTAPEPKYSELTEATPGVADTEPEHFELATAEAEQTHLTDPVYGSSEEPAPINETESPSRVDHETSSSLKEVTNQPIEIVEEPTVSAHLFPAFNPSAPPPPIKRREPTARNPNVKLEGSFKSLIEGQREPDESSEKQDGGLFGRFLGRSRKG